MAYSRGYDDRRGRERPSQAELQQRMESAHQRMEDSSRRCVELMYETMAMATDTSEELEVQAEALERTERRLDEMDVALESSRRNMREVKSIFGGFVNSVTKPKFRGEKPPSKGFFTKALKQSGKKETKSFDSDDDRRQTQATAVKKPSTGNAAVDRNLDQLEAGLKQLEGQAHLIGHQLDESNDQIERISWKMHKNDDKLLKVTRDARRELLK